MMASDQYILTRDSGTGQFVTAGCGWAVLPRVPKQYGRRWRQPTASTLNRRAKLSWSVANTPATPFGPEGETATLIDGGCVSRMNQSSGSIKPGTALRSA